MIRHVSVAIGLALAFAFVQELGYDVVIRNAYVTEAQETVGACECCRETTDGWPRSEGSMTWL